MSREPASPPWSTHFVRSGRSQSWPCRGRCTLLAARREGIAVVGFFLRLRRGGDAAEQRRSDIVGDGRGADANTDDGEAALAMEEELVELFHTLWVISCCGCSCVLDFGTGAEILSDGDAWCGSSQIFIHVGIIHKY